MDLARILSPADTALSDAEDAAPPLKRRVVSPRTSAPALPRAVLRGLFESHLHELNRETIVVAPTVELPSALRALACVNHEWNALAHDITAEIALSQMSIELKDLGRGELLEFRRRVTLQRKYLRSLSMEAFTPYTMVNVDVWDSVLSHVPRLEKLDLGRLRSVSYRQLAEIVKSAGRQCVEVHKLKLPRRDPEEWPRLVPQPGRIGAHHEALFGALAAWSKDGLRGGTRDLMVDMSRDIEDVASACSYIDKVIRLCPALERNSGALFSSNTAIARSTEEQWMLNLPTWMQYCASVANVTKFEWLPVPFATAFFDMFGQFPKPKLTHLDLTPALNWNWAKHLQDVDDATLSALKESGFADKAVNIGAVLRACPNLKELEVRWGCALTNHDEDHEAQPKTIVRGVEIPSTKLMNPEIIDDDFCEALATYCSRLEIFELHAAADDLKSNRVIRSFTDRGLRSLARLPRLTETLLETVNITGAGLYSLVIEHNAAEYSMERIYHIAVGEKFTDIPDHSFYDAAQEFTELLLECEGDLPCENHNVVLHLRNHHLGSIDRNWSKKYLTEMKDMIKLVREKHPTVEITISTAGYRNDTCLRIEEFAFTIGPKMSSFSMDEPEEQIDEIIYNRIPEWEVEDENDDGMDSIMEFEAAARMAGNLDEAQVDALRTMYRAFASVNSLESDYMLDVIMDQLTGDREVRRRNSDSEENDEDDNDEDSEEDEDDEDDDDDEEEDEEDDE